ncbi:amino acid-binding protein [Methanocella sp. CWC-04]|uniref:Amino acid-binding protein n=1 Tax=Methanooceanicella nereidis TaxID=2052831 RepID=A0AAP2RBD0_9EURY|nr:amino acid-binding protein [Methanocella sp. CWC-04]MCD1293917.1 amino acid-binding protein [Methanocella sp. CWC-04]
MRITMDLELKDIPGQLVRALEPISDAGGNIVSVVHHHENRTPRGTIPIQVIVDMEDGLTELKNKLESRDIKVVRVDEAKLLVHETILIVGHIIHSDIRDTIDQIDSTGYAEVVDLAMSMPGINLKSSARIGINATGKDEMKKAVKLLRDISKEKELLIIEPIDTEGM